MAFGRVWFGAIGGIGRITPSGAVSVFPIPTADTVPGELTVGPDAKFWFPENQIESLGFIPEAVGGRIGEVAPSQFGASGVVAVTHLGKAIRSIRLGFNAPLDSSTAGKLRSYSLAVGMQKRHTFVFGKGVKIGRVSYDYTTNTVRLTLARPRQGPLQVTVRAGTAAVGGMFGMSDLSAVVE